MSFRSDIECIIIARLLSHRRTSVTTKASPISYSLDHAVWWPLQVTVPKVRMSAYGTPCCRRRNHWLPVSTRLPYSHMALCRMAFLILSQYFPAFTCHEQGASSLIYAPQHQLLISAGKKGDICIFDVRQRSLRHRFQVSKIRNHRAGMNIEQPLI